MVCFSLILVFGELIYFWNMVSISIFFRLVPPFFDGNYLQFLFFVVKYRQHKKAGGFLPRRVETLRNALLFRIDVVY